jgi:hypothetical protein
VLSTPQVSSLQVRLREVVAYISGVVGQNVAAQCVEQCTSGPAVLPQDGRLEAEAASLCRPGKILPAESIQAMLQPQLEELLGVATPKVSFLFHVHSILTAGLGHSTCWVVMPWPRINHFCCILQARRSVLVA